jgi:hypothetical protein
MEDDTEELPMEEISVLATGPEVDPDHAPWEPPAETQPAREPNFRRLAE